MDAALKERIEKEIQGNKVVVYMKGTPVAPMCGFSAHVAGLFSQLGVQFHAVDVIADANVREGIKQFSNWPTIPQIFIDGKFVGGCDIITELHQRGELETMVKSG